MFYSKVYVINLNDYNNAKYFFLRNTTVCNCKLFLSSKKFRKELKSNNNESFVY